MVIVQGNLDPIYGSQSAGGSRSTPTNYEEFHRLGATARTMLIQAAAETWKVPASELIAHDSAVHHSASRRKLDYGQLVAKASALPVPDPGSVQLKDPKDYKLLGTRIGGIDNPSAVTGKPLFGIDVKLPGMLMPFTRNRLFSAVRSLVPIWARSSRYPVYVMPSLSRAVPILRAYCPASPS